jgi:uncharacterized membrane protein (DUF2068 family)
VASVQRADVAVLFGWAIATMLVFEGLRAVNALGLWMVDVVWAFLTQRDIP